MPGPGTILSLATGMGGLAAWRRTITSAQQGRRRHRPCLTIRSRYRRKRGGDENAAMIAPHAVITVGTADASFGTASVSA